MHPPNVGNCSPVTTACRVTEHKERNIIHAGRLVQLGIEQARLPNGQTITLEVVRHPGGAAIVAINHQQHICLVRQFRHAAGGWLWELPAGKLEPDETPLLTAQRELQEEAGVTANQWNKLGETLTTPGFCDEVIHLFLARDLSVAEQALEQDECLEVHWLAPEQIQAWMTDGTIRDAKTLLGLFLAMNREDG